MFCCTKFCSKCDAFFQKINFSVVVVSTWYVRLVVKRRVSVEEEDTKIFQ